jgi:hypothetical protein
VLTHKLFLRKLIEVGLCTFFLLSVSAQGQTSQESARAEKLVTLAVANMT